MEEGSKFDKHGFLIEDDEDIDICHSQCFEVYHSDVSNITNLSTSEIREIIFKGMSTNVRSKLWPHLLKADEEIKFDYQGFLTELDTLLPSQDLSQLTSLIDIKLNDKSSTNEFLYTLRQISVDIDRTFPNHQMFKHGSLYQLKLFHILSAYTQYNKPVGYCQGMAYIVAMMLMQIENEETVFWCFVSLLESKSHFCSLYNKDLKKVRLLSEILSILTEREFPELAKHLLEIGVHPLTYATQWFMTLFTCLNCWESVLFIADLFFLEGIHQLLNIALVILKLSQSEILEMKRIDQILPFIQKLPAKLICRQKIAKVLSMSQPILTGIEDLDKYWSLAEEKINQEEISMEEIRENYRHKNNRKRKFQSTTVTDTPGFISRLFNAITPAKKPRFDEGSANIKTPSLTTMSVSHSAMKSLKRGQANIHYTPDSGLVYTSPNTIEMKKMVRKEIRDSSHAKKLSYDDDDSANTPNSCENHHKDSPLLVQVKSDTNPRRSSRIAQRKLTKNKIKTTELV